MAHLLLRQLSSQPFTPLTGIGTSTIAAAFTAMSDNSPNLPTSLPPGIPTSNSLFASLQSSLQSEINSGRRTSSTLETSTIAISPSDASPASTNTSPISTTTNASSASISSAAASITSSSSSSSTDAATGTTGVTSTSTAAGDGTTLHKDLAAGGLSAGEKAAIAVPVIIVAFAAIILAALCLRRRKRRRQETGEPAEKVPLASKNKKWTRHLRIFSFDTELLMGGRYSSTNSIRSRETASVRSQAASQESQAASVHSVDEVAPPYRDAISSAQPPSIGQVMTGGVAAGAVARSASTATAATAATAPPPYGAGARRLEVPTSPASTLGPRNPFSDSTPVSPVDASPFNDPPGVSPAISRNSSLYNAERDDTSTIGGASDAASIREATLARNASVMSGGRIINNVNKT